MPSNLLTGNQSLAWCWSYRTEHLGNLEGAARGTRSISNRGSLLDDQLNRFIGNVHVTRGFPSKCRECLLVSIAYDR